jgi:peptidyl-prolyl cis-trans isomerase SurA
MTKTNLFLKNGCIYLFLLLSCIQALLANASPKNATIAVEINKDVITYADIQRRAKLIMLTSGSANQQPTKEILEQIKEALIQEKLQQQVAQFLKVIVLPAEVDAILKNIARENNMSLDDMKAFFSKNDVDMRTLEDRIRSNLLWSKSVSESMAGNIMVSDRDITNEEKRLRANEDKEQFEIAQIVFLLDDTSAARNQKAKTQAVSAHNELKQGIPFSTIARNFSQEPSSAQGGLVGWLTRDQIPENVAKLSVHQFSEPIERGGRITIYYVKDHKMPGQTAESEAKMSFMSAKIELPENPTFADQAKISGIFQSLENVSTCAAFKQKANDNNLPVEEAADVPIFMVPDTIRAVLKTKELGKPAEPIQVSEREFRVFVLCGRKSPKKSQFPTHDEIEKTLREKRMQEKAITEFNRFKTTVTIVDRTNNR